MVTLYVFSLVLGGGLLGLSLLGDLFGGHDIDMSTDASIDFDAHMDAGMDGGMDAGVDAHMDADSTLGGHDGSGSHAASKILSIRTTTYTLFGFGAVGVLLTYVFHASSSLETAAFAVVGGILSGTMVHLAFSWTRRSESGALETEDAYTGLAGRMVLPMEGTAGRVLVDFAGRTVRLRALPHPSALDQGDPTGWESVVIVEMNDGVALVAPLSTDLLGA